MNTPSFAPKPMKQWIGKHFWIGADWWGWSWWRYASFQRGSVGLGPITIYFGRCR